MVPSVTKNVTLDAQFVIETPDIVNYAMSGRLGQSVNLIAARTVLLLMMLHVAEMRVTAIRADASQGTLI